LSKPLASAVPTYSERSSLRVQVHRVHDLACELRARRQTPANPKGGRGLPGPRIRDLLRIGSEVCRAFLRAPSKFQIEICRLVRQRNLVISYLFLQYKTNCILLKKAPHLCRICMFSCKTPSVSYVASQNRKLTRITKRCFSVNQHRKTE